MDILVYITTCGTKLILGQPRHEVENLTILNMFL